MRPLLASLAIAVLGCSGSSGGGKGGGAACAGHALPALAPDHLLIGLSTSLTEDGNSIAQSPGFDLRYLYISGGLADGDGPCTAACSACTSGGASCANSGPGCAWWGCWQWDAQTPGVYASGFVATAEGEDRLPMFTYYMILQSYRQSHALDEGTNEVTVAARDVAFMARYWNDFRFLLQRIGTHRALVHLEPDFWGYAQSAAQQASVDPHHLPAAVASANPTDCAGEEDTIAGMGRCAVAMVRRYAPSALVGLHASPWASGFDLASNPSASVDPAVEGARVGEFLTACGAASGDVIVADLADRDADDPGPPHGYWLHTDETLPDFTQILAFGKAVATSVGKPILWWQVPVGNPGLDDSPNHYRDNRLDWFLDHPADLARQGAVGAAFGGGQARSTTPETDGGHLEARARAYAASGGQKLCN
ncbi:MAG TPA: hypothetical protein VFG59_09030 [Anaeromyxobacter sp.]|nr:hypothetical protein [Anaeromyxobacter sp.]